MRGLLFRLWAENVVRYARFLPRLYKEEAAWNTPDAASPRPSPKGEGEQLAGYPGVFERTEWEKGASPQPSPKGEGG